MSLFRDLISFVAFSYTLSLSLFSSRPTCDGSPWRRTLASSLGRLISRSAWQVCLFLFGPLSLVSCDGLHSLLRRHATDRHGGEPWRQVRGDFRVSIASLSVLFRPLSLFFILFLSISLFRDLISSVAFSYSLSLSILFVSISIKLKYHFCMLDDLVPRVRSQPRFHYLHLLSIPVFLFFNFHIFLYCAFYFNLLFSLSVSLSI